MEKFAKKIVFLALVVGAGFLVTGCEPTLGGGGSGNKSLEELTTAANNGDATAAYQLGQRHLDLAKKADKKKQHEAAMKHYGEAEAWLKKAADRFNKQQ
ncbi:MAG: hypothetical protein ACPGVU_11350 [Limisphaerales bacterium]